MTSVIKDISNNISEQDRAKLSAMLETLMLKYGKMSRSSTPGDPTRSYFNGVVDGLEHAHKLINEIEDDYLLK